MPHPAELPLVSAASVIPNVQGTYWLPIPSLVLGIIFMLVLLDDSDWNSDSVNGMILFRTIGLGLGIAANARQKKGLGKAIAGVVMSSIGLVFVLLQ